MVNEVTYRVVAPLETGVFRPRQPQLGSTFQGLQYITLPFGRPFRVEITGAVRPLQELNTGLDAWIDFYYTGVALLSLEIQLVAPTADDLFVVDRAMTEFALGEPVRAATLTEIRKRLHLSGLPGPAPTGQFAWAVGIVHFPTSARDVAEKFAASTGREFESVELLSAYESNRQTAAFALVGVKHFLILDPLVRASDAVETSLMSYSAREYVEFVSYYAAAWQSLVALNGEIGRITVEWIRTPRQIRAVELRSLRELRERATLLAHGFTPFNFGVGESLLRLIRALNGRWQTDELLRAIADKRKDLELRYNAAKEDYERGRDRRIATVAFFLTLLTMTSVLADVIMTLDYDNTILPSVVVRGLVLLAPPLAFSVIALRYWIRSDL